jgi:hypothetical protein
MTNKELDRVSLQMMKLMQAIDILTTYYLSSVNMHEVLKFVNLHSIYSLAVKYINSMHNSRLVMNSDSSN